MGWFTRYALGEMFPRGGPLKGVADTALPEFLARFRREAPWLLRIGLGASVWVYMLCPLFTIWVPLPAFLLPASWRKKHTYKLAAHSFYPLRMSAFQLKMIAGMCWGMDPDVRKKLGAPPLVDDPGTFRATGDPS